MKEYLAIRDDKKVAQQAGEGVSAEATNSALLVIALSEEEGWQMPPVEQTLPLAEVVHQALVWLAARGTRIDCPELTGHERNGQPLQRPHTHAHIFPLDLDEDRHIDHVFIHAPMGFSNQATRAIRTVKVLHWRRTSKPFTGTRTDNLLVDGPVEYRTDGACNGVKDFIQCAAASLLTPS